ncbi:hypothetical protein [Bifidobacterium sp. SO1]|uniref:hypothetical protein n=1 Tax=Bifidobacterium sp. SO1 TaxID=2809029 RepID=UPI001BDCD3D9|nr:hypothetical protein [Bifidobacterium sp. SO1]MBT1161267.1 hypothetical protein [Bifidobacterium sp. SO1]
MKVVIEGLRNIMPDRYPPCFEKNVLSCDVETSNHGVYPDQLRELIAASRFDIITRIELEES